MKNKTIILLVVVVCLITISYLAFSGLKPFLNSQGQKSERIIENPQVVTKVNNLEVININESKNTESIISESEMFNISVKNNSDKPIIAIVLESGDGKDVYGVIHHQFAVGDAPPKILANPQDTIKIGMNRNNLKSGSSVRVSSVMYDDETVEGETSTTGLLRQERNELKNKRGGKLKQ